MVIWGEMNTRNWLTRLATGSVTCLIAMAALALPPAAEAADFNADVPNGYQLQATDTGGQVLVPSVSVPNKAAWLRAHPVFGADQVMPSSVTQPMRGQHATAADQVTTMGSTVGNSYISSVGTGPYNNATMLVDGRTSLAWLGYSLFTTVRFTNSRVTNIWLGSTPATAQKIKPVMRWWLTGINLSVGVPLSAGLSLASGNVVTYNPGSVANTWQAAAVYPQAIDMNAAFVWSANFQASGDFMFGGTWYHVEGN